MSLRRWLSIVIFILLVIPVVGMVSANRSGDYEMFVFMAYTAVAITLTGWLVGDY
ncbi:MAG: hypothetical protein P1U89_01825 [Verrucomicrobiales bacterium]|nr:hypothetical protein [Verrucomicrobiales bacterium]